MVGERQLDHYQEGLLEGAGRELPQDPPPRCWVHKTANVLNALPKARQRNAKQDLHQIWMAAGRAEAEKAMDTFAAKYQAKYPKAVTCLPRTGRRCSRSTTSRRSTGSTSGPRTPSRACSRRSGIAPLAARAASPTRRRWRWSSSW